jgi:hypothetical protein
MTTVTFSLSSIAETIKKLNKKDLETLSLLLTDQKKELLQRKKDLIKKKVKTLSLDEVFSLSLRI